MAPILVAAGARACLWKLAVVVTCLRRGCFQARVVEQGGGIAAGWSDCFYAFNSLSLYFITIHWIVEYCAE